MDQSKTLAKILVIEDEKDILKSIEDILSIENFSVISAMNGKKGLQLAADEKPDLILLDLRLPDMDGYDVCRRLKQNEKTKPIPVIILSTRSKPTEKVIGLEIGADDYLTKPFNEMELLARIRVALRRTKEANNEELSSGSDANVLTYKSLTVNQESRSVRDGNKSIKLTRKEFDLLYCLLSKPGKAYTRRSLMELIWGEAIDSMQGTVDSHIKTLRKKLGAFGSDIETVSGIGYRWKEEE